METDQRIDLDPYVGKTICEIKEILSADTEKIYEFRPIIIFNQELIDMTPDDDGYPLNQYGTYPREEMTNDYVVVMGDSANVRVIRFFHQDTFELFRTRENNELMEELSSTLYDLCELIGFTGVELTLAPIPTHLIHHGDHASPFVWYVQFYFRAKTHQGLFGIMIMEGNTLCLDLTHTCVTCYDLCNAVGILADESLNPNLCYVSQEIMEAFYKKMAASANG